MFFPKKKNVGKFKMVKRKEKFAAFVGITVTLMKVLSLENNI